MEKNNNRIFWGFLIGIIGFLIILLHKTITMPFNISLVFGLPLIVIGIIIIINKSEDTIEKRKDIE